MECVKEHVHKHGFQDKASHLVDADSRVWTWSRDHRRQESMEEVGGSIDS